MQTTGLKRGWLQTLILTWRVRAAGSTRRFRLVVVATCIESFSAARANLGKSSFSHGITVFTRNSSERRKIEWPRRCHLWHHG
jgi:hypothetical protein